jgi:hypothetical protein
VKFSVGDRVRVIADIKNDYGSHLGQLGTVITVQSDLIRIPYVVKWDSNEKANLCYGDENLEPITAGFLMHAPEMELDEIHQAQDIMEGLK